MRWIADFNPMVALVSIYQQALLYDRSPDLVSLAGPAVLSIGLFVISFLLFRRASHELIDAL